MLKSKKIYADMRYAGYDFSQALRDQFNQILEIIKQLRKHDWVPSEITNVTEYLKDFGHEIVSEFKRQPKR